GFTIFGGKMFETRDGEFDRCIARDNLPWLAVNLDERRTQHFVPFDDCLQCTLERVYLNLAVKTHGHGNVVERSSRLILVHEPQSLLCERQRHWTTARYRDDRWSLHVVLLRFDQCGHFRDSRTFKDRA